MSTSQRTLAVRIAAIVGVVAIGMMQSSSSRGSTANSALEIGGFLAALITFVVGPGAALPRAARVAPRSGRPRARARRPSASGTVPWWMAGRRSRGRLLRAHPVAHRRRCSASRSSRSRSSAARSSARSLIDRRGIGVAGAASRSRCSGSRAPLSRSSRSSGRSPRNCVASVPLWMLVLPVLAGIAIGWQQAVNGQVRIVADSALTATFVNFAVGVPLLAVATLISLVRRRAGRMTSRPNPALYLGGVDRRDLHRRGRRSSCAITGVLVLGLATIAGSSSCRSCSTSFVPGARARARGVDDRRHGARPGGRRDRVHPPARRRRTTPAYRELR